MSITWRQLTWAGYVISGLGGMVLGVGITIKALDKEYEQNLAIEIANAKKYYDRLHKRGEFSDPVVLVEERIEPVTHIIESAGYSNVFADPQEFNLGEEIVKRNPERPYVITDDEFFKNDTEYEQINLQYYTLDAVLCEQDDTYVRESDDIVGDDNLLRFGDGSNDANIVYVRNDRLEKEYEVIRVKGSYQETVHGVLEHSDRKRKVPKKSRRNDE